MAHGRKAKEARSRKPRAGNLQSQTCALLISVGLLIASCLGSWPYFQRGHLPLCCSCSLHVPGRQGAERVSVAEPDEAAASQFWDHHADQDSDGEDWLVAAAGGWLPL